MTDRIEDLIEFHPEPDGSLTVHARDPYLRWVGETYGYPFPSMNGLKMRHDRWPEIHPALGESPQ